jgi:hypothetical protein
VSSSPRHVNLAIAQAVTTSCRSRRLARRLRRAGGPGAWGICPKCVGSKNPPSHLSHSLYLNGTSNASGVAPHERNQHEPNVAVRNCCRGVRRFEPGRFGAGHRNRSSRPHVGPKLFRGELPGCDRQLHSLVPRRPPDTGQSGDHVGLEYLPRLVLELGGCRRHCRQHDLPVAWRSARCRASTSASAALHASSSAAFAGGLPLALAVLGPLAVRRPLVGDWGIRLQLPASERQSR